MIFKKLFQPKYQNPDPQVRMKAIETLSPEHQDHKSILHELAFNDGNTNVNLAALEKLNSFSLWCKIAQTAKLEHLRKKAQLKVENAVLGSSDLSMSEKDKVTFAKECKQIPMLEKLVKQTWLQEQHPDLLMQLLDKIDKPHVERQLFQQTELESLQYKLAQRIEGVVALGKALKKAQFESVKTLLNDKIAETKAQSEKPKLLQQQAKLLLSQLLALKDKQDLPYVENQRTQLLEDYHLLSKQYDCLDSATRASLQTRYEQLNKQLDSHVEQLRPQWNQIRHIQLQEIQVTELIEQANARIEKVNQLLAGEIAEINIGQIEQHSHVIINLESQLKALENGLNKTNQNILKPLEKLFTRMTQCQQTLARLPELQVAIGEAKRLIQRMSDSAVPDTPEQLSDAKAQLKQWQSQWREICYSFKGNWPQALQEQFDRHKQAWIEAIRALEQQAKSLVSRAQSKLKATENLINQGKFKAAMTVFQKAESAYAQLDECLQHVSLKRKYDEVAERIVNLKEWQSYIAAPRKPKLLEEAQALAEQPLANKEQSLQVKRIRQAWLSLGELDTNEDKAINDAFDIAIEKAFEPCRQHFAMLDQQRAKNLEVKQELISQFSALHEEDDHGYVAKQYNELQSRWKATGPVDFGELDKLNAAYKLATDPLKKTIKHYHHENAQSKQRLLDSAVGLLQEESLPAAIEQAKSLQSQWQAVGPASHKLDKQLWQSFRNANDQLFEKRQARQQQQNQQQDALKQTLHSQLEHISERLKAVSNIQDLDDLQAGLQALTVQIGQVEAKQRHKIVKQLSLLEKDLAKRRQSFLSERETRQLRHVFELLESWQGKESLSNEQLQNLPGFCKAAFSQPASDPSQFDRLELTIMLEIVQQQPSPESDEELRQALKLQMMSDKLQNGEQLDKFELLSRFIQAGPVTDPQLALVARVKRLFVND